jgi:hypothetical protein
MQFQLGTAFRVDRCPSRRRLCFGSLSSSSPSPSLAIFADVIAARQIWRMEKLPLHFTAGAGDDAWTNLGLTLQGIGDRTQEGIA